MNSSFFPDHVNPYEFQILVPDAHGFNNQDYVVKLEAPPLIPDGTLVPTDRKEQEQYWRNKRPKRKLLKCKPESLHHFEYNEFEHFVWFGPIEMGGFDKMSEWIQEQTIGKWSIRLRVHNDEPVTPVAPFIFLFEDQRAAVLFKMFHM